MNDELKKKLLERMQAPPDPPFEATRKFLLRYVTDKDSTEEIEADIEHMSQLEPRTLIQGLAGIEQLLADPPSEEGALSCLVAWEVGWVLKDDSDEGVKVWLKSLVEIIKKYL